MLQSLLSVLTAVHMAISPGGACVRSGISNNVSTFTGLSNDNVVQSVSSQLQQRGWTIYSLGDDGRGNWTCQGRYVFSIVAYAVPVDSSYAFALSVRVYEETNNPAAGTSGYTEHISWFGAFAANNNSTAGNAQFSQQLTNYVNGVAPQVE